MLFHKDVSHIHMRMSNVKIGKVQRSTDCFNQTPCVGVLQIAYFLL